MKLDREWINTQTMRAYGVSEVRFEGEMFRSLLSEITRHYDALEELANASEDDFETVAMMADIADAALNPTRESSHKEEA